MNFSDYYIFAVDEIPTNFYTGFFWIHFQGPIYSFRKFARPHYVRRFSKLYGKY